MGEDSGRQRLGSAKQKKERSLGRSVRSGGSRACLNNVKQVCQVSSGQIGAWNATRKRWQESMEERQCALTQSPKSIMGIGPQHRRSDHCGDQQIWL